MKSSKERPKLTRKERVTMYNLLKFGCSKRRTAKIMGRSHATIIRECKRNPVDPNADYIEKGHYAHELAHFRRIAASRKMRLKTPEIRHYVNLHLKEAHWSPEIIAGKLTQLGYKISAEAIYQYINEERPDLKCCLLIAGKSRKRRRAGKQNRRKKQPAAPKQSIETLPIEAKERHEIGHFELDAMHGKKGQTVIQNKIDRLSRKMFLDKSPTLEAKPYADLLIKRFQRDVPKGALKTILQDNGPEHAEHKQIDSELGCLSYFCHPYCASERGTVENRNGALRRFLPKGVDLETIPDDFIEWVEDYFNNMPMKVLNFRTPNEVWVEGLKNARGLSPQHKNH